MIPTRTILYSGLLLGWGLAAAGAADQVEPVAAYLGKKEISQVVQKAAADRGERELNEIVDVRSNYW
jgi:hypothetical protein